MNLIAGVDPGTTESGIVVFDFDKNTVIYSAVLGNETVLHYLKKECFAHAVAFEKVASYGMAVGKEVFETVFWTGRFFEALPCNLLTRKYRITRNEVKNHICHSSRAKDANIRQALIDRFGEQGTKKNPGALYGIKTHLWPALAVAVTLYDTQNERTPE